MRGAIRAVLVLPAFLACAASLGAQGGLGVRAVRRDSISAQATFTAAFTVSSYRADSVSVLPHVEVPPQWTILTGNAPIVMAPVSHEVLMVSVAVPARVASGVYPIRVWVTSARDPQGVADSVVVVVPPRRALDLGLLDKPGFVVSGNTYQAQFLLRNRGNQEARVKISARSSLGVAAITDSALRLGADESRVISASVRTPAGLGAADDDVLEIAAEQIGDSAAPAPPPSAASARVTVVPEPSRKIEEYLRVPVQLHLRAASSDGVSPFALFGRGAIRDGSPGYIDFLARGPTGKYSAFGERDEYRLEISAPRWRARVGDHLFQTSSLTGLAQPGFGAGADGTLGMFALGAFGQEFRRLPEKGVESGAFLSARPRPDARLAFNVVNRVGGLIPGRIGSASASLKRSAYVAEVEVAGSRSADRRSAGSRSEATAYGLARSARLSGATPRISYDLGHIFADTAFTGLQRGSEHDYLTASTHLNAVSYGLNASTHRTDLSRATGVPYDEQFDLGTMSATLFDRYTLELGAVRRGTTIQGASVTGRQRGARLRADQEVAFGALSFEAEAGRAVGGDSASRSRMYSDVSLGIRRSFERGGGALWADRYGGGSITKGSDRTVTLGGDLSMRLSPTTDITLMGYATRLQNVIGEWHSQLDAQVAHTLSNGSTVSLRARLIGGGSLSSSEQSVAYVEYGVPLRLPVSRLRTPGRVRGRVVDAVSGRGVSGALVRLGPQVAITDKFGQVAFGGVPAGEHRLSMSQEASFAEAVFVGDPTLRVDSTRAQPTTFELAIARGAKVEVSVRRFAIARTAVGGPPDSLVDAGAVTNATLVLAGVRDTLFRTTGANGTATFTDVPPGIWTIAVRGDAPAFTRFDPDRLELTLASGDTKALTFRLVPRKREVQLIGESQELVPTVVEPKSATQQSTIRTGKPNENRPNQQ